MKFLHLADLHLGKRIYGFSMLEDQKYILDRILDVARSERPDAVLIAGDVYDRPVPPVEAVHLLDEFLTELSALKIPAMIISGNHDSADRIAFGSQLMERSGIYISPVYDGTVSVHSIQDEFGFARVFLIPFLRPAVVRSVFPEEEIADYTDAMRTVIGHLGVDPSQRNVAIAHQFVTAGSTLPETCDSEQLSIGGLDQVDASVFDAFDYVALGHLHGPQRVGRETIRYAGSPLQYSFSELHQRKSVTMVELRGKGNIVWTPIPIPPMRKLAEIRGTFQDILYAEDAPASRAPEDYYHIILTDEQDIPDALSRLRERYPNIMLLDYDNARTRSAQTVTEMEEAEELTPEELFSALYEQQNGAPMDSEQLEILRQLIREVWEDEE